MALLTARDISVEAGGNLLLRGLSISLEEGELVALVGPSGSGKTTLLRALALLSDPATGELELRGRRPAEWGYPAYRRRVTLVAQRPVLLDASVRENLQRPFAYRSSAGSFPAERAAAWLDRLGLGSRLDQAALSLSEGQQQRVALVRALLVEPDVALLDEPTSALDAESAARVEQLVSERVREGRAALVVTHDRTQAERWCDRVVDLAAHLQEGGHA